ncbi:hypothetical protein Hamer_G021564 [Homarus americanus]|uniref:Uncharacterized protein n=1 Tax=Homarus americanus TaxID=6706 RepID=A0A8J5MZB1_HOMAM|nr:hypothetical protein Hamer_G021564 [Homarus americanus]
MKFSFLIFLVAITRELSEAQLLQKHEVVCCCSFTSPFVSEDQVENAESPANSAQTVSPSPENLPDREEDVKDLLLRLKDFLSGKMILCQCPCRKSGRDQDNTDSSSLISAAVRNWLWGPQTRNKTASTKNKTYQAKGKKHWLKNEGKT